MLNWLNKKSLNNNKKENKIDKNEENTLKNKMNLKINIKNKNKILNSNNIIIHNNNNIIKKKEDEIIINDNNIINNKENIFKININKEENELNLELNEYLNNNEKNKNNNDDENKIQVPQLLAMSTSLEQQEEMIQQKKDHHHHSNNNILNELNLDRSSQLDLLLEKAALYSNFISDSQKLTDQRLDEEINQNNNKKRKIMIFDQPDIMVGGELKLYQQEGVRWLCMLYENGLNGILGDEMGLGKTIQVIGLLAYLYSKNVFGPFLIIAPLATLMNWYNELNKWVPSINALLYHGNKNERELLRNQYFIKNNEKTTKFPIIITSFEISIIDHKYFENFLWQYIILDEGHRIKNRECKLMKELKKIPSENRLLLTGTPIQNSLDELWSLLNFVNPLIFDDLSIFQSWFDFNNIGYDKTIDEIITEEKKQKVVTKLHEILKPFLLRRLKKNVGLNIPPKKEIIVYANMSKLQKDILHLIDINKIREVFSKWDINKNQLNNLKLINKTMLIRKLANHPFLLGEPRIDINDYNENNLYKNKIILSKLDNNNNNNNNLEIIEKNGKILRKTNNISYKEYDDNDNLFEYISDNDDDDDINKDENNNTDIDDNKEYIGVLYPEILIHSSGKLSLLDRMLKILKEKNSKVLLFSQMTEMMKILEDYCLYRNYSYCILDGSMGINERQEMINKFNDMNENIFIFLISTRAGGQGINLAIADTCIIFDSDWNPQQDLQAQDRCHRIGQKKPVIVYRLITKESIEVYMLEKAISKRKLERLTTSGDYTTAGRRKSKQLSIDKLEFILQDDIKSLTKLIEENNHNNKKNNNDNNDILSLHNYDKTSSCISDIELNNILNKQKVFGNDILKQWSIEIDENINEIISTEGEMYDFAQIQSDDLIF